MTHKRFRAGVAWFMVIVGAIAVTIHDYIAMIWVACIVLVVMAFLPLLYDILQGP